MSLDSTPREPVLGQKIHVGVGEPWDFESPAGPNALEARYVTRVTLPNSLEAWIMESDSVLKAPSGAVGRLLVMSARHVGGDLHSLLMGRDLHVNLSVVPEGQKDWGAAVLAFAGKAHLIQDIGGG